jgi:methylated-DNA-[protein]-cysteine S-methyltransferase
VCLEDGALVSVDFLPPGPEQSPTSAAAAQVVAALRAYLADPRSPWDLPLALHGTPFQHQVWEALRTIPPGQALTYGELAHRLDTSARAIGGACGANPVPIVVPCHRVVAVHGLGGYGGVGSRGRLDIKRWLLAHEGWPGLTGISDGRN